MRYRELGRGLLFGGLGFSMSATVSAALGLWPFWVPVIGALLAIIGAVLFVGYKP